MEALHQAGQDGAVYYEVDDALTKTTPTAAHTIAFTHPTETITAIAEKGSLLTYGIRS